MPNPTPVALPPQYLGKGFEDSINLESPPRLNLDVILQSTSEGAFCTEDNVHGFAAYLNQELTTIGFSPVMKDTGSSGVCDTVQMLNCIYELLQQHHQHLQSREDMAAMHSGSGLHSASCSLGSQPSTASGFLLNHLAQ